MKLTVRKPTEFPHVQLDVPAHRVTFDDYGLRLGAATADQILTVEFTVDEARAILRAMRAVVGDRL